jgi:aspartate carbamoyltransferase catalytic subunit
MENRLMTITGLSAEQVEKVREFAETENFNNPESNICFEYQGQDITNPFIDESARFPLTDEQAVKKYGEENIRSFFEQAITHLEKSAEKSSPETEISK